MNIAASPAISVIMCVYNGRGMLESSIKSVLAQSFSDFEFIILDDASTDNPAQIVKKFDDARIRFFQNSENTGLTRSLNKALKEAKGKYIARLDCGDICTPDRLESQVSYLDLHEDIDLLGGWALVTDENRHLKKLLAPPEKDVLLRHKMLFSCPFYHPLVMFRKTTISDNGLMYNESFYAAQDYDLWSRLLQHSKAAVQQKPLLLLLDTTGENISFVYRDKQRKFHFESSIRNIGNFTGIDIDRDSLVAMTDLFHYHDIDAFPTLSAKEFANCAKDYIAINTAFVTKQNLTAGQKRSIMGETALRLLRSAFKNRTVGALWPNSSVFILKNLAAVFGKLYAELVTRKKAAAYWCAHYKQTGLLKD